MKWQAGLRLQFLVSELLKGTQVPGLESRVVDVLALLNQPRALDRSLARYVVAVRDVFASAPNISLCTDKGTVSSLLLQKHYHCLAWQQGSPCFSTGQPFAIHFMGLASKGFLLLSTHHCLGRVMGACLERVLATFNPCCHMLPS